MNVKGFVQRRLPWVVSIGLHLLMVLFLLAHWPDSKRTVVEPPSIRAVVMGKPKTQPRDAPKPKPKPAPKPEPVTKPAAKPEPKPQTRQTPKPAPKKPALPDFAQPDFAAQIA